MNRIPYIDIHTHSDKTTEDTVCVRNIFPGESFAEFTGRNFYSAGLHPWYLKSKEENNSKLNIVEEALGFNHIIFVGECGLDKTKPFFEEQKRVFEAQAFMAEEFRKPLIIHCVKAYNEIFEINKKMHPEMPWIMHGYSAGVETTKQFLRRNFCFSFGKNLFNINSKAIASFKYLSPEKIFFETDESETTIEEIYEKGAELKGSDIENIKTTVWQNFNRIENILISGV